MNNLHKSFLNYRQLKHLTRRISKLDSSLGKDFIGTCWKSRLVFLEDEILITVTSETQEIEFTLLHGKLLRGGVVPTMLKLHQTEIRAILENWLEAEDE